MNKRDWMRNYVEQHGCSIQEAQIALNKKLDADAEALNGPVIKIRQREWGRLIKRVEYLERLTGALENMAINTLDKIKRYIECQNECRALLVDIRKHSAFKGVFDSYGDEIIALGYTDTERELDVVGLCCSDQTGRYHPDTKRIHVSNLVA